MKIIKFASVLFFLFCIPLSAAQYLIIGHPSTTPEKISKKHLKRILTAKQTRWQDGTPITLVKFSMGAAEEKEFTQTVLKMRASQVRKTYLEKLFSGKLPAEPIEVDSAGSMMRTVKTVRGAIGYIKKGKEIKGVKVLKVD